MKKIILTIAALIPATVWAQSSSFTLTAKIGAGAAPQKAYLMYQQADKLVTDSAIVQQGTFQFKGVLKDPLLVRLVLDHQGIGLWKLGRTADYQILYLEKGNISLTAKDSVKNAVISGSKLNEENAKYLASISAPDKALQQLNIEYAAAPQDQKEDQDYIDGLQARANKAIEAKKALQLQYVKQNPNSYISVLALTELAGHDMDVAVMEPLFKSLSASVRGTDGGQAFAKLIEAGRATAIGAMAPDFTQNDANDKQVSLSGFRGKYVLLDFWASWCGPCRGENPNVVKAYHQYQSKNFTVLGVSLDRPGKKADWLAAVKADGLEWTQVSDLKFWDNAAAKQYGIRAIPQNYLIDPTGKIVGKNLRGEELNKKLASIFN